MHSLALPTYLASAASTADLQSQILPVTSCATDIYFDTTSRLVKQSLVLCQCLILFLTSNPSGTDLVSWHLGQWLSLPFFGLGTNGYTSGCICPSQWRWLLALPVSSCGLKLSYDAVHGSLPASRLQHLCGSYLQMWSHGGCSGATWPALQAV